MSFETFSLLFVLGSVFAAGAIAGILARWISTPMPAVPPLPEGWDAVDRHLADAPVEVRAPDLWQFLESELAEVDELAHKLDGLR